MSEPKNAESKKPGPALPAPGEEADVPGGTGDVAARRAANPDGVGRPNDPPLKGKSATDHDSGGDPSPHETDRNE